MDLCLHLGGSCIVCYWLSGCWFHCPVCLHVGLELCIWTPMFDLGWWQGSAVVEQDVNTPFNINSLLQYCNTTASTPHCSAQQHSLHWLAHNTARILYTIMITVMTHNIYTYIYIYTHTICTYTIDLRVVEVAANLQYPPRNSSPFRCFFVFLLFRVFVIIIVIIFVLLLLSLLFVLTIGSYYCLFLSLCSCYFMYLLSFVFAQELVACRVIAINSNSY